VADQEGREALREHLVQTLYKALGRNFEITFAEGYRPAADAILALVDVEEQWRVVLDEPEHVEGVWQPFGPLAADAIPKGMAGHFERRYLLATKPERAVGAEPEDVT
jgi:hypothetical protein